MTELAKYDAACRALAAAVAVDEVQEILNQAEAWRHYAHQAKNRDLEIGAAHIRFRAERRLGEILTQAKEKGQISPGRPAKNCAEPEQFSRVTLEQAGIDRKLSSRAQRMAAIEPEKFERLLERHRLEVLEENNKVSVDLMRTSAEQEGREKRRQLATTLSDATSVLPTGRKFPCVYADPPWHRKQGVTDLSYENHYPTMTWAEICAMPVADLLLPDAWVFLWIPRAHLLALHPVEMEFADDAGCVITRKVKMPLAWAVARAWGCDNYSTCFVWTKTDEETPDDAGMGLLVRDQDEILLMFKRGRGLPKPAATEKFGSNHRERKREHSRKPDHYREMIRTMTGGVPVLELFARVDAEHPLPADWEAWGNQAKIDIAVDELAERAQPEPAADLPASQDGLPAGIVGQLDHASVEPDDAVPLAQRPGLDLSEFDQLKAFSDFCFPQRAAILAALAPGYVECGLAYSLHGGSDWGLTEAGWKRFHQLDAERRAASAAAAVAAAIAVGDDGPEIVDGVLQCRLPLDDDEIELQRALTAIAAGEPVAGEIARHLVGLGHAHATTTRLVITDEGRAWLASFADAPPMHAVLDLPLFLAAGGAR